jgi:hypothetical protein
MGYFLPYVPQIRNRPAAIPINYIVLRIGFDYFSAFINTFRVR